MSSLRELKEPSTRTQPKKKEQYKASLSFSSWYIFQRGTLSIPCCIFPLWIKVFYLAHDVRRWGVLMFGDENALRWNILFFFSWLNYVCVHCQVGNCCSYEGCFKRTFLPLAQNTLPPYYRDCLAYTHMQPYGNIKWRGCTPQWTHWISMSISRSWLIMRRLGWLLLLAHLLRHPLFYQGLQWKSKPELLGPLFQLTLSVQ